MSAESRILVVDDEPDICELVKEILVDEGYQVITAQNGEKAREYFSTQKPDLVLLDIWMPDVDGISLLKEWQRNAGLHCPVVMMSGHGSIETAVEATRSGAYDFIEKPLSMGKLLMTVSKALQSRAETSQALPAVRPEKIQVPIGNSIQMQALRQKAEKAAEHGAPVLISGEPGVGKETVARYIHSRSARSENPFLVLDSNTQTDHDAGHYLRGNENAPGLFAQTGSGTLYISDLCSLPAELQNQLDGVLERGQYTPIGSTQVLQFAGRIITACSDSLEPLLRSGKFLESLYFQLNVLPLEVPPLRDRLEDVPELVKYYSEYFPNRDRLPYRTFSVAALNRMRNYFWPGNVRELRNLIQRLLILGQSTDVAVVEVDEAIRQSDAEPAHKTSHHPEVFDLPLREAREQFEREYLIYQLRKADGSVGKLSEAVGMERTHLYRKLRSLGIDPKTVNRGEQ